MDKSLRKNLIIFGVAALVIIIAGGTAAYLILTGNSVTIDTASIQAPLIDLAPDSSGRLNAVYVQEGDSVAANAPVAEVGTEIVTAKVAGTIVSVHDTVGANINAGDAVVTEIDPTQLRVVGSLKENEGLAQIQVGDPVSFTVDAFGGKTFAAVVDEVAPTSNASDVVFSVSSQREEQTFDVKARFDISQYPQLKNGMSARMTVYTGS
ncbi:MAG: HlyD family efflux transporter periplasmic adaptor subunit [Minisyncoccia bacterium]